MSNSSSFKRIELQEGMQLVFKEDNPITVLSMFGLMAFASFSFGHQPVVCLQFLPGLDVRLNCNIVLPNDEVFLKQTWCKIQLNLLEWINQAPPQGAGQIMCNGFELQLFRSYQPMNEVMTFSRLWSLPFKSC